MRTRAVWIASSLLVAVVVLAGCSDSSSSMGGASASSASAVPSETQSQISTFGEPSGLWDIPREVQVAYVKAICTAPGSKLGFGGTFNDVTQKCLTPNGMESDVDFGMRGLLANDAEQMRQSTQFMVTQAGVPVDGCPTVEEYTTVVDLTITNDCVIAAMKATITYLGN